MSREVGLYVGDLIGRRAETRTGHILSENADLTYEVRDTATDHIYRASRVNLSDRYAPGTAVLIGYPSGSKRMSNSGLVIMGRAPQALRNASGTTRDGETVVLAGISIARITPRPVSIPRTQNRALTIYGTGFTVAPTYSDAGLTNFAAPVITSTQITLSIQAGGAMAIGFYNLTLGSHQVANVIEVT